MTCFYCVPTYDTPKSDTLTSGVVPKRKKGRKDMYNTREKKKERNVHYKKERTRKKCAPQKRKKMNKKEMEEAR